MTGKEKLPTKTSRKIRSHASTQNGRIERETCTQWGQQSVSPLSICGLCGQEKAPLEDNKE